MLELRDLRAADDLPALQPQWWALWRGTAVLAPTGLPWCQVFHPEELHSIAAFEHGRLVVVAALYHGHRDEVLAHRRYDEAAGGCAAVHRRGVS